MNNKEIFGSRRLLLNVFASVAAVIFLLSSGYYSHAASGPEDGKLVMERDGLPLRSGPAAFFEIVGYTRRGVIYMVMEDDGRWMLLRADDGEGGYLSRKALRDPEGARVSARYSTGSAEGFGGRVSSTAATAATRGLVPVTGGLGKVAAEKGYDVGLLQELEKPVYTAEEAQRFEHSFSKTSGDTVMEDRSFYFSGKQRDIGRGVLMKLVSTSRVSRDAALRKYVSLVGMHVNGRTGFYDELFVYVIIDDDDVQSWALPGGFVVLSTGAIRRMQNEAELAFVLAHEISHCLLGHGLRELELQKERVNAADAMDDLDAEVEKLGMDGGDSETVNDLENLIDSLYNYLIRGRLRQYELEADALSVGIIKEAGYSSSAGSAYLGRLGGDKPAGYVSHPAESVRIEKMNALITQEGRDGSGKLYKKRFRSRTSGLR